MRDSDARVQLRLDSFDERLTRDVVPTTNKVQRWKVAGVTVIAMAGLTRAGIAWSATWGRGSGRQQRNGAP